MVRILFFKQAYSDLPNLCGCLLIGGSVKRAQPKKSPSNGCCLNEASIIVMSVQLRVYVINVSFISVYISAHMFTLLRGGYTQQRETSSFLDLETSFLVHIWVCLISNGPTLFKKKLNVELYNIFFHEVDTCTVPKLQSELKNS